MSLSTTNQGSLVPPILALWPSVRVNQPGRTQSWGKNDKIALNNQWSTNLTAQQWNRNTPVLQYVIKATNLRAPVHTFVFSHDCSILNGDKVPRFRLQILKTKEKMNNKQNKFTSEMLYKRFCCPVNREENMGWEQVKFFKPEMWALTSKIKLSKFLFPMKQMPMLWKETSNISHTMQMKTCYVLCNLLHTWIKGHFYLFECM